MVKVTEVFYVRLTPEMVEALLPPREPTILEMMVILGFFLRYGARTTPGHNLLSFQLADMPDDVNAYWTWMHMRPWD